jgi:hypothetical protein
MNHSISRNSMGYGLSCGGQDAGLDADPGRVDGACGIDLVASNRELIGQEGQ